MKPTTLISPNKKQVEAGKRFTFPQMGNDKFKLIEEQGREFIAILDRGRWILFASIDVVTDFHIYLLKPGADPLAISFDLITIIPDE